MGVPLCCPVDNLTSGKILLTGAAGFIGSVVVAELNNRGYENIIVSDYLDRDERFLNLIGLRFEEYVDANDLLQILEDGNSFELACIFHLGACAKTIEQDCNYLMRNNYEYTKALACFAAENNIRFVYASSAATYGDGSNGMADDETKLETLRPFSMYAYSKHLFDLFARNNGLPAYGMKYFNVFGPNEYHKGDMGSVVMKAHESIVETGKVRLFKSKNPQYADGYQRRDFLYIKDAVDMAIFLANVDTSVNGRKTHGIYNLGSEEAHSWIDLVTPVFETMGAPINIEYVDMPKDLEKKYQYYTRGDISKLRSIGYDKKLFSLGESVSDYVKNYLLPGNKRMQDVKSSFVGG
ncbi:MAG: ADP-glyceromanno-heptose 6-epimerase [Puniceicoccales bacterium]|jgi:ADP-L-glycero-D-manno-heptose 6-epimerase|nr:ADP-glyceromanno-heptose 6-epimerase [Puniceicoccales bacterium]